MTTKTFTIVAPHVDDEVIGCYSLLDAGLVSEVIYLYEVDEVRKSEALACAKRFGFKATIAGVDYPESELQAYLRKDVARSIVLPSAYDSHPDHKKANAKFRPIDDFSYTSYYGVDMSTPNTTVLSVETRDKKRHDLYTLFPSQASLFNSSDKYHLFEDMRNHDCTFYRNYGWTNRNNTKIVLSSFGERGFPPSLEWCFHAIDNVGAHNIELIADRIRSLYPKLGVKVTVNESHSVSIPI